MPFSLVIFTLLWLLYGKCKKYKIAVLIRTFSSWGYLVTSLIGDYAQYLSFRCFEQFHNMVPEGGLEVCNTILMYTVLFVLVFSMTSLHWLALEWADNTFQHQFFGSSLRSVSILSGLLIFKIIAGFLHACTEDPGWRILALLCLQIVSMIVTVCGASDVRGKFTFIFHILGQMVRCLLYGLLGLEVAF